MRNWEGKYVPEFLAVEFGFDAVFLTLDLQIVSPGLLSERTGVSRGLSKGRVSVSKGGTWNCS